MKVTIDLPDDLVTDIKVFSVHRGLKLKVAVAELLRGALISSPPRKPTKVKATKAMLERRAEMTRKFLSGEWSVELAGFEANEQADKTATAKLTKAWQGK